MARYAIYDETGTIIQVMDLDPEHIEQQVQPGQFYLEADVEPHDSIDVATKTVIRGTPATIPASDVIPTLPAYAEQRKKLYPSIEQQLDMLWHAMDSGEMPKAEAFYYSLATVKLAVPKTDEVQPVILGQINPIE